MTLEVFIRTGPGERRVSLTKNGKLNRVQIDRTGEKSAVDGIYFGRITEVNRSLNAAFVDIGMDNAGFLAAVDAQSFDHSRERPKPIGQLFSEGETVLVQVTRDSLNGKGAKLTTNLSISAFNLVLKPGRPETSVSRQIEDQKERNRLGRILQEISLFDAGFIARPRATFASQKALVREAEMLGKDWNNIKSLKKLKRPPSILLEPPVPLISFLLNSYEGELEQIRVDDRQLFADIQRVLDRRVPELLPVLELHDSVEEIFAMHDLTDQWEQVISNTVQLPSGGSLIIEETAAMTTIDVNSGKQVHGIRPEESNLAINIEAVTEIARQVTLRNLGGQIIVDLLYQKHREKRALIMKTFQEAIYEDRRNINLIGFTRLGMFELTRRRRGKSLNQKLFKPLENLKSPLTLALDALYQVKRETRINPGKLFLIHAPPEVTEAFCFGPALEAKLVLEKEMCGPIEVKTKSGQAFPEVSIITDIGGH